MSEFELRKKSDKIDAFLLRKGIKQAPIMRVGAALDISGSMSNIIGRGHLQLALNQLMGAAMRFDDNGELDVFKFDDHCEYVGTCSPKDYETFVDKRGIRVRGGTNYAPIVTETQKFFFDAKAAEPAKKSFFGFGKSTPAVQANAGNNIPVLMMVITDGEVSRVDRDETNRLLTRAENTPIYYHFVGVGGSRANFPSIAYLADERPNVGEVYLPNFGMSDDEVYDQLICDELIEFVAKFAPSTQIATSA